MSQVQKDKFSRLLTTAATSLFHAVSAYSWTLPNNLSREFERLSKKAPQFRILRFERIGDRRREIVDRSLRSSFKLDALRKLFEILQRECEVVSIKAAISGLISGEPHSKGQIALCFDGGFEEHARLVTPLLDEFQFPGAFFLPTAFIGTNDLTWSQKIEASVRTLQEEGRGDVVLRSVDEAFSALWAGEGPESRVQLLLEYLRTTPEQFRRTLVFEELLELTQDLTPPKLARQFMTWEEVKMLAEKGHLIGTIGHRGIPFEELSTEALGENIRDSFQTLKKQNLPYTAILACPRGEPTEEQRKVLRSWGIEIVLDERTEILDKEDESWVFPRVSINSFDCPSIGMALRQIVKA